MCRSTADGHGVTDGSECCRARLFMGPSDTKRHMQRRAKSFHATIVVGFSCAGHDACDALGLGTCYGVRGQKHESLPARIASRRTNHRAFRSASNPSPHANQKAGSNSIEFLCRSSRRLPHVRYCCLFPDGDVDRTTHTDYRCH